MHKKEVRIYTAGKHCAEKHINEAFQGLSITGLEVEESEGFALPENLKSDANLNAQFLYQSLNRLCEELTNIKSTSDEKISDLKQILNNSLDDSEDRLKLLHKLSNEVETLRLENKDYVRMIKNRGSALAKIKKEKKALTDTLELIKEKITSLSKEIEM